MKLGWKKRLSTANGGKLSDGAGVEEDEKPEYEKPQFQSRSRRQKAAIADEKWWMRELTRREM